MLRSIAIVAGCALLAASPSPGQAKCARMGLAPVVLTPQNAAVPLDGGVVVGITGAPGDHGDVDEVVQRTWRFRVGAALHEPKIETLAPGLAVYRLPVKAPKAQLEDGGKVVQGKITFGEDKPLALAAPKVKRITHQRTITGRGSSARTEVELGEAVPPGAVAIVLADAKGAARSWGGIDVGALGAVPYAQSRCGVLPNGTLESSAGDQVTVFWVDRAGRRSPASAPVKIVRIGKPGADVD